jgi:hypothetical protein
MDNLLRIKRFSVSFHFVISLLLVIIPVYYVLYWALINHLPTKLITVNLPATPLIPHELPVGLQLAGFAASLFPLSALLYGLLNIRKLFSFYKHVVIFKNTAKALVLWVILSMLYESVKSILFSAGNPPGSRVIEIGFSSSEISILLVGGIALVIAWVMDEGRILSEENRLTV